MGATVHVVGNGTVAMARDFAEQFGVRATLWTDPSRRSFALAGLHRRFGLGPKALRAGLRAFRAGFRQGRTQGDPWQQGGVLVVGRDGRRWLRHADAFAGDHADLDAVLQAVERAVAAE
ncbi:MAG: AhpC/TSA family protein [Myxococcales bacterium]|nr:AhpC/TSA family protein [Myxococcales bacterium]